MQLGGHVKKIKDIYFLQEIGFDLGEVVLRDSKTRSLFRDAGITNRFDTGFFLIAHGPFEGPPNDIDNLWERYHPSLLDTVDLVERMGISFLTVHLWMDRRFVHQDLLKEKRKALADLVDYGLKRGVEIGLENLSEDSQDLSTVLDHVPETKLTLDVGHAQLLSKTNTSFGIIEALGDHIAHVHLHDNHGGKGPGDDTHLPIGEGIVDIPAILEALLGKGYDRTATLELEKDVLVASKQRIERILSDVKRKLRSNYSSSIM